MIHLSMDLPLASAAASALGSKGFGPGCCLVLGVRHSCVFFPGRYPVSPGTPRKHNCARGGACFFLPGGGARAALRGICAVGTRKHRPWPQRHNLCLQTPQKNPVCARRPVCAMCILCRAVEFWRASGVSWAILGHGSPRRVL